MSAEATAAAVGSAAGLPSLTGNAGRVLTVNATNNGVLWGAPASLTYQAFTASGTWTKPANCTFVYVECIGAGGSGSHSTVQTSNQSGGAGGGYADILLRASDLAGTVTVTVGAGGAGVLSNINANGNNGGASFFGTHLSAPGGRGGIPGTGNFVFNTTSNISPAPLLPGSPEILLMAMSADGTGGGYGSYTTGGNAMKGGGGGGGNGSPGGGGGFIACLGGVSQLHGSGGAGNFTLNLKGGDGVAPGGGGGGSGNNGGSGSGARGEVRVWAW